MISRPDAERLAGAIHSVRPEWRTSSLVTLISEFKDRALRDVACALMWIALERDHEGKPINHTPQLIREEGAWWIEAQYAGEIAAVRARAEDDRRARRHAVEDRLQAAAECSLCDASGRLHDGSLCDHSVAPTERAARARLRADGARAALREPSHSGGDLP